MEVTDASSGGVARGPSAAATQPTFKPSEPGESIVPTNAQQPYAYVANDPLLLTDPTGLDFWGDVRNNGLAFGAGVLNGATGGISSAILSATVPGYECLVKDTASSSPVA